jgi:cytochrome c oxidase assembly protein subunit 15
LWQALDLLAQPGLGTERLAKRSRYLALGVVPLLLLQVIYGAFMAGTRAGYLAATFPDMNGHYAPSYFFGSDIAQSLISNPLTIHYLHRALAFALLGYAAWLAFALRAAGPNVRASAWFFLGAVLGQGLLGVMTVMLRVPIGVAVVHQGGAYVLCGAAVLLLHAVSAAAPEAAARNSNTLGASAALPFGSAQK